MINILILINNVSDVIYINMATYDIGVTHALKHSNIMIYIYLNIYVKLILLS